MSNVVPLPTRAASYYTVRKSGKDWLVQLVTPCPGKDLRTVLARASSKTQAMTYAAQQAALNHRPFKMGRAGK